MSGLIGLYIVAGVLIGFLAGNLMCYLASHCKNKILQKESHE
jgi:hypothetical protein